ITDVRSRRRLLLAVIGLGLSAAFAACGGRPPKETQQAPATAEKVYECPMHPDVRQSTPGKCPKCGMQLLEVVPAAPASGRDGHSGHGYAGSDAGPPTDHSPKHGGMLGMQGDRHVELVERRGGEIEVYVYDAWTRPIDLKGASGTVTLEMPPSSPPNPVQA